MRSVNVIGHRQVDITKQQTEFENYLANAPKASSKEVADFLSRRTESEENLNPAIAAALQKKIHAQQHKEQ